jgi:radical SAM superfamily enzyme YgiQ (UPF0313 family)
MRVLFVIAPWSYATVYPRAGGLKRLAQGILGTPGGPSEPLGVLCLAAYLKARGHEVAFIDGALCARDEMVRKAVELAPDVVGLSIITHTWEASKSCAALLEESLPAARLIAGGPHVTCWREDVLRECEAFDAAVAGEGEEALAEYLEGREPGSIPGLIYRTSGGIAANPERPPIRDLDALPFPDYSLIDIHRYRPSIGFYNRLPSANVITTRGCPHRCTFCISRGRLTERSIGSVLSEMEQLIRTYGIRHFTVYDESFTLRRERVVEFCEGTKRLGITWCANARVDEVDGDLLALMRSAGCWKLLFGIESGVQKNLDTLGKRLTPAKIRDGVEAAARGGIETFGCFIFGIPGETFEEGLATIDFAVSLPLDYAAFLNLVPYKGTEIHRRLEEEKEVCGVLTGAWSTNRISFVPSSMTREELERLNVLAARRFYRRPSYLIARALKVRSLEDIRRGLIGLAGFLTPDRP